MSKGIRSRTSIWKSKNYASYQERYNKLPTSSKFHTTSFSYTTNMPKGEKEGGRERGEEEEDDDDESI